MCKITVLCVYSKLGKRFEDVYLIAYAMARSLFRKLGLSEGCPVHVCGGS